jgi:hypothetical protein
MNRASSPNPASGKMKKICTTNTIKKAVIPRSVVHQEKNGSRSCVIRLPPCTHDSSSLAVPVLAFHTSRTVLHPSNQCQHLRTGSFVIKKNLAADLLSA